MAASKPQASAVVALVAMVAIEPIQHDGKRYEPGEILLLTEAQAAVLVDQGAAAPDVPGAAPQGLATVATPAGQDAPPDPAQATLA